MMTKRSITQICKRLGKSERGVTAIEFAMVSPVFFMMVLGGMNLAQMAYGQAVLTGAVNDAARFSALETGDIEDADEFVEKSLAPVLPDVEIEVTRANYFDFADIDRAEPLGDTNGNGECDVGETFGDMNGNETWDESVSADGNGGANDVVVYTVTATYTPMFNIPLLPGAGEGKKLTASTVRKNQPFAEQAERVTENVACS